MTSKSHNLRTFLFGIALILTETLALRRNLSSEVATKRILLLLCLFLWPLDSLHASQIAYYSFDGTAEDVSGNGNHGVVVNGVFSQGEVGLAILRFHYL